MLYSERKSFVVPAESGTYAPERIQLNSASAATPSVPLLGVTALLESMPASSAAELWLLKAGGDPTTDADYFLYASSTSSTTWSLASWKGAQVRVKSGGTAGTAIVNVAAD